MSHLLARDVVHAADGLKLRTARPIPPRTNARTGRVDHNWTKSGGKASWPGFLFVGELAQVPHYPETRTVWFFSASLSVTT